METHSPATPASLIKSSLTDPRFTELLDALYVDASTNDPAVHQAIKDSGGRGETEADFYRAAHQAYMPVSREFGHLLYALARTARARTIVEFGTSFGISTLFLAAAVRDNGEGRVITSEFVPEKAARARQNLAKAGLEPWVEVRVGNALETLSSELPSEIDLVLLDGAKGLYLPVLQLLEARLRRGGIVASDNTDHDGMDAFLAYLRLTANGYTSAAILTGERRGGHEITVKN